MLSDDFTHSFSVCGIFQVTNAVGQGTGERIMRAFNINTGAEVAIKSSPRQVPELFLSKLQYEIKVYALIPDGTEGFPAIHYAGPDANHTVLVMDKLGPTLEALLRVCRGTFSLRTICMLADQMLDRVRFLHSRGVVSSDIKPSNFAMGRGKTGYIVHMFDLETARMYVDPDTGAHVPFCKRRRAEGTARYASLSFHTLDEISRRDDVESLLYILLEFFHGSLPWQGLPEPKWTSKTALVGSMKADQSPTGPLQTLLARSPPEFATYHAHVAGLQYGEKPDYALLSGLFRERMRREGWAFDGNFDWIDVTGLDKGTLLPEEYVVSMDFVEEKEWNPHYM